MTYTTFMKLAICAGSMLVFAGCASTSVADLQAERKVQEQEAVKTANLLTGTKNVTVSEDGNTICKRQEIAGSRFKRKICLTAEEWEKLATENRANFTHLHRRASQITR